MDRLENAVKINIKFAAALRGSARRSNLQD
jgi:hypothetical protein